MEILPAIRLRCRGPAPASFALESIPQEIRCTPLQAVRPGLVGLCACQVHIVWRQGPSTSRVSHDALACAVRLRCLSKRQYMQMGILVLQCISHSAAYAPSNWLAHPRHITRNAKYFQDVNPHSDFRVRRRWRMNHELGQCLPVFPGWDSNETAAAIILSFSVHGQTRENGPPYCSERCMHAHFQHRLSAYAVFQLPLKGAQVWLSLALHYSALNSGPLTGPQVT